VGQLFGAVLEQRVVGGIAGVHRLLVGVRSLGRVSM